MTSALEGGERSASRPGRTLPPGKTRCPLYRRLSGPQGRSRQVRKISPPPAFDPQTVQAVGSRYTDYIEVIICSYFEKYIVYGSARTHRTRDSTELLVINFPVTYSVHCFFHPALLTREVILIQLSRTFCPWRIFCKSIAGGRSPFSGKYFSHTHEGTLTACSDHDTKIHWGNIPRPSPDKKGLNLAKRALTELVECSVFYTTEFFFIHSKQFPVTVNLYSQYALSESHPDYFVLL